MGNSFRPTKLEDIIGNGNIKQRLAIIISAAINRNDTIPHMLFHGAAGCGKTTYARAIANERNSTLHQVNAGNVSSPKDLLPIIYKLETNDVLFIDEIHRLNIKTSEMLYTVMEDFIHSTDVMDIEIDKFTMVGATTEAGSLSRPMLDRFVYKFELKLYNDDDLVKIMQGSADRMGIAVEDEGLRSLAKISRGTPRIANQMITWVRDYIHSKGSEFVSNDAVTEAVDMMGIDSNGFTEADRLYMETLRKSNRAMGLSTIADATGIDTETITGIIEPYLLRKGFIQRTGKGRILCQGKKND